MSLKFNINRPKISDEEIKKHQDFDHLLKQFKEQSLKQAQGDESWRKNKKIRYTAVIAGVTVVCTITYLAFSSHKKQQTQAQAHETVTTKNVQAQPASSTIAGHQIETNSIANSGNARSKPVTKKTFICPPSQKLNINYNAYKVNNATGGTIAHSTASKIKVPKNSFVDKNGHDIVGDVTIEYKEYHDLGDVVASGIPMAYDSAGTHYNLESAGMFDIRGSQNGEAVFIKPGKNLEIELASKNKENRFNQYYLDTLKKNWQYLKKDQAVPVKKQTASVATISEKDPETIVAKDQKLQALKKQVDVVIPKKIDSVKVVYVKRAEKLATPKAPAKPAKATGRPAFTLDASTTEFPELQAFKNAVFEVGDENKNYTKELHDITWSSVTISQGPIKGKNYLLTLKYRNRQENLVVYPVLNGADYDQAKTIYDHKFEEYQALVEKRQADEQRLMKEMEAKQAAYLADLKKKEEEYKAERAKLLARYDIEEQNALAANFNTLSNQARATRIFNVSKFGIYNSDCPRSMPQGVSVDPVFVLNSKQTVFPEAVYLVDHDQKTVFNLSAKDGLKLTYNPANAYSLCVFAGGKLFLCNRQEFKQAAENQSKHFTVTPLPEEAHNLPDFKKALEI